MKQDSSAPAHLDISKVEVSVSLPFLPSTMEDAQAEGEGDADAGGGAGGETSAVDAGGAEADAPAADALEESTRVLQEMAAEPADAGPVGGEGEEPAAEPAEPGNGGESLPPPPPNRSAGSAESAGSQGSAGGAGRARDACGAWYAGRYGEGKEKRQELDAADIHCWTAHSRAVRAAQTREGGVVIGLPVDANSRACGLSIVDSSVKKESYDKQITRIRAEFEQQAKDLRGDYHRAKSGDVCRLWEQGSGKCPYGSKCKFVHGDPGGAPPTARAQMPARRNGGIDAPALKGFDDMCAEIAALEQRHSVPAILAFMRRHLLDSARSVAGCQALCSLAARGDYTELQTHPTAECLVAAMAAHPSAASVQEWAMRLLCRMAALSASDAAQIAAAGGIERVLAAMSAHSGVAAVQQWGCQVLSQLASHPVLAERVKSLGAADSITRAMAAVDATCSTQTAGKRLLAQLTKQVGQTRGATSARMQSGTLPRKTDGVGSISGGGGERESERECVYY